MAFEKNNSNNGGLIFFVIVVLIAGLFIFFVRTENNASNPFDGLFVASDTNTIGYYGGSVVEENATLVEAYFVLLILVLIN